MSKPDARTLARQAAEREAARRGRLIAADGPTFTDVSPDPAVEQGDGRCCENGKFGVPHDCMRQPAPVPAGESATITVDRYYEVDSVRMLAEERWRQIEVEGWTAGHDDDHYDGELARAAEAYLFRYADGANATLPGMWPARWHHRHWKPSDDPIRNLVKAGALILAEIDRLLRAAESLARERGGPLP